VYSGLPAASPFGLRTYPAAPADATPPGAAGRGTGRGRAEL